MNEQPLVSIIIPVYNGSNYLREAINSALAQTYQNIEILVINDGSSDNGATEEIALSYGNKIRYIAKENGGVATALNLGIREMRGDYFSWLSHDDLYYPRKIARQIEALWKCGDHTAIVQSEYDLLDMNSHLTTQVTFSKTYSIEQLTNSVFPVLQGLVHGCDLLIHKSQFDRVGTFDESLISTQDYDLWFRMFRGQKTIYLPEPLMVGRLHNEQGSRTLASHKAACFRLHTGFMKALSEEEICSMYGSTLQFYYRMCCFFKGEKMEEAYRLAHAKFQESEVPENLSEELLSLQEYVNGLSQGKADRICIFCAGDYGQRLYYDLRSKLIPVDCFSDNDPQKWGYFFHNLSCIPPEQLAEIKEQTLVIVAMRTPDEIVAQLKAMNFPYLITKQELDRVLLNVPPVKWITALDSVEGVDYSSKETQLIINKFDETIIDICKFFREKVQKYVSH